MANKKREHGFQRAKVTDIPPQLPPDSRGAQVATLPGQPTESEIAARAYARYLERAGRPGNEFDDWIEAEQALRAERGIQPTQ